MTLAHRGARIAGLLALAALVVLGGLASYLLYRHSVGGGVEERAFANARTIVDLERRTGLAWEAAAQRSPLGRGPVGRALTAFYALAYWPFVAVAVALTARWHRPSFRLLRNAVLISGAIGLVTILLVPVAPPRLLDGFTDSVARSGTLRLVAHPSSLFNPHAALPSFHVAWTVLAALSLRRAWPRWGRVAFVVPAVMAVAVVTTGNHWVLDVVAGAAVAAVGWKLAPVMQATLDEQRLERQRARRLRSATAPGRA